MIYSPCPGAIWIAKYGPRRDYYVETFHWYVPQRIVWSDWVSSWR